MVESKNIKMKQFLKEIKLLKKEYNFIKNKEEKFNIFSILHKPYDEERLHSRFIASLLSPFGSHRLNELFLKKFIIQFVPNFDCKNAEVITEYYAGEYGRIDILIKQQNREKAIIIENKIYAGDQDRQLKRYFEYMKNEEKLLSQNITTLYLTLDGHEPSLKSLGKHETMEDINCHCISYSNDIIKWLDGCLREVCNKPFIRESINQYIKLLKEMTNNEIDIEQRKKLQQIVGNSLESSKYLIDNFKHIKWHTIADFWSEIEFKL